MAFKLNPLTGQLDLVGTGGASSADNFSYTKITKGQYITVPQNQLLVPGIAFYVRPHKRLISRRTHPQEREVGRAVAGQGFTTKVEATLADSPRRLQRLDYGRHIRRATGDHTTQRVTILGAVADHDDRALYLGHVTFRAEDDMQRL